MAKDTDNLWTNELIGFFCTHPGPFPKLSVQEENKSLSCLYLTDSNGRRVSVPNFIIVDVFNMVWSLHAAAMDDAERDIKGAMEEALKSNGGEQ